MGRGLTQQYAHSLSAALVHNDDLRHLDLSYNYYSKEET